MPKNKLREKLFAAIAHSKDEVELGADYYNSFVVPVSELERILEETDD